MATATGQTNLRDIGAGREPTNGAAIVALTHAVGTGNDALVDVGAAFNQGTLNDNFRDLSDKIAEILTLLQNMGMRN